MCDVWAYVSCRGRVGALLRALSERAANQGGIADNRLLFVLERTSVLFKDDLFLRGGKRYGFFTWPGRGKENRRRGDV